MKHQNYHHIETSQLIYRANQLTVFYMMATLVLNELTSTISRYYSPIISNVLQYFAELEEYLGKKELKISVLEILKKKS